LSATIALENVGGGTLNWQASSDTTWLTLGAASGEAPATLTLSANPAGFAASSVNSATVTLRAVDSGGNTLQTVTVPVSVYVGNPGYEEPTRPSAQQFFYLPIVRR
jgi:hypothetical protein